MHLKPMALALLMAGGLAAGLGLTGCKKAEARGGDRPITGKASDPAATFEGRWDETNAYVYHLETITGTQVPRRNSEVVIQQDTVLAKDLRFGVTNITREGVRAMSMEVQAVRVETTADQRLTSAFDTENELLSTEDNSIASRLRRVKGARLGFKLAPAPSTRVVRVDGAKEFNDRVGSGRNVRGAAGAVLNKFFNQQFYRDLVEMTFLPTNPVRIGESWTNFARSGAGLYNNASAELIYTFRGWQWHEGTNCARFDFVGGTRGGTTNRKTSTSSSSSNEEAELEGTLWFSPDIGVPVELEFDQSITRQTTSTRVVRMTTTNAPGTVVAAVPGTAGTNATLVVDIDDEPDVLVTPPPGNGAPPASPSNPSPSPTSTTTSRKTTTKQHVKLTLIEIVPVEAPPNRMTSSEPMARPQGRADSNSAPASAPSEVASAPASAVPAPAVPAE
jgi:hypothetical protein